MNRNDQKLIAKAYTTVTESIATEPYNDPERDPTTIPVLLEVPVGMLKQAYENQDDEQVLLTLITNILKDKENFRRYNDVMKATKKMTIDPLKNTGGKGRSLGREVDYGRHSGWTGVA